MRAGAANPPERAAASKTVTSWPCRDSLAASVMPSRPPPTTATLRMSGPVDPRFQGARGTRESQVGEVDEQAEVARDGSEDLHLRPPQHAGLQGGRVLHDTAPRQIEPTQHLRHAEESTALNRDADRRLATIHAEAARVGVELLAQDQPIQPREAGGQEEAPARHVLHPPERVVG